MEFLKEFLSAELFDAVSKELAGKNVSLINNFGGEYALKADIDAEYNDKINKLMFDTKSRKLVELEKMVLEGAEYHFDGRCMLLCVTADMQEKTGCSGTDLEGIAVLSRSVEGVIAGVTLKQTGDNEFKASLRTYPPLNASAICKQLGGGGHTAAAGATVNGSLEEVKSKVLGFIEKALEETDDRSATCK